MSPLSDRLVALELERKRVDLDDCDRDRRLAATLLAMRGGIGASSALVERCGTTPELDYPDAWPIRQLEHQSTPSSAARYLAGADRHWMRQLVERVRQR